MPLRLMSILSEVKDMKGRSKPVGDTVHAVPGCCFKLRKHLSEFKVSIWLSCGEARFTVAQQPVIYTRFLFTTSYYTGNLKTLFSVKNGSNINQFITNHQA